MRCNNPFALVHLAVSFPLDPLERPRRNEFQAEDALQVRHFDKLEETE